jgi:toxin ParE1/3/4
VTPVYHDDARDEVREGMDFYDGRRQGLGFEFYQEVSAAVAKITHTPRVLPFFRQTIFRKVRTDRFPYTLYFAEHPGGIWIAAVRRDGRNDSWLTRQPPTDPA